MGGLELFLHSSCLRLWSFPRFMESLLDVLFMFDSVPMDLYPACAKEMYSDNVIK
jgi:hypothetical protein